jgi:DNA-directed RNA polymerase specialized sigma24 family protein
MDASNNEMTSQATSAPLEEDPCRRFFEVPLTAAQRQYEALRAVIIDELPQKEVAERFGYTYDSLRQLLHEFRTACHAGEPPPFSPQRGLDDPRA